MSLKNRVPGVVEVKEQILLTSVSIHHTGADPQGVREVGMPSASR